MYYDDCQTTNYNPVFIREAYSRPMASNNSMPPLNFDFRIFEENTSFSSDYEDIVEKWADSFKQLNKTQQKSNYNSEIQLPVDDTVSAITSWLNEAFAIAPDLEAPDIVPDAEGGLDIEWDLENQFVSIHIDHSDKTLNRIFIKNKRGYRSEPLTKKNLKALFAA